MIVGDSIAYGLANEFKKDLVGGKVAVANSAIIGCGDLEGERRTQLGRGQDISDDCKARLDSWKSKVESFNPGIALMLPGGFEVFDHQVGDTRYVFGTDEYKKYFLDQMDKDIKVLSAKGAKVVILNVPCYQESVMGGFGDAHPERRDPARPVWLNERLKEVAAAHPNVVRLVDLHDHLCPTGDYQAELDGVKLYRDGMHYTPEGAAQLWKWLGPQLKTIVPPAKGKLPAATTTTTKAG